MKREDRERLEQETIHHHWLLRFQTGLQVILENREVAKTIGILCAGFALMLLFQPWNVIFPGDDFWNTWKREGIRNMVILGGGACIIACIVILGTPRNWRRIQNALQRIGLVNHPGEAPYPVRIWQDPAHERVTIVEFEACGIPLSEWEDMREYIEAALNVGVAEIREGKEKRRIQLYTVPITTFLPPFLEWKEEYLSENDFELILGESLMGQVKVDLAKIPHILIGGSTGSGKSVLLKLLLTQCVRKGAEVVIADFKGGVDFPPIWHKKCSIVLDKDELLETLTGLVSRLEARKLLFRETGCANLTEFNERFPEKRKSMIFACDEVAELLDKAGLSKEEKDLVYQIENKLSILARQGRAFGIHLILATQRPDATILTGQIRNNLDCRICGRADNVLSQIILDSTDAADRIPKYAQGRFLTQDGTLFQAYWFDEVEL